MKTYYVSEEAIVIGLEEKENLPGNRQLAECLLKCGLPQWEKAERDIFCFQGMRMLIARPASPKCLRACVRSLRRRRSV